MRRPALILALFIGCFPADAISAPVLMISIDGLMPGDLTDSQKHGLKIPVLRGLMDQGAYATGVKNVLPTLTYPNHTTLLTGVSPARHGIPGNSVFDPLGKNDGGWYWYASDIKTETLWDAAHKAKRTVANLIWPVSVGAGSIDANIPEYWRSHTSDDVKLIRALSTPGLADELETPAGAPFAAMFCDEPECDDARASYAVALIAAKRPGFMTLHFDSLDHGQHVFGPNTPETHAILERIDSDVGRVVAAARAMAPDVAIAIVSDHGFASLAYDVNLKGLFAAEGLLTPDADKRKVVAWQAAPWPEGGAAAVVLAKPEDAALRSKVAAFLAKLQSRPELGIAKIIDQRDIAVRGVGMPADFYIDFKPGYEMGFVIAAPDTAPSVLKGMHGYFPDAPDMRAALVISGRTVAKRGSLGEIDMRDIAPTLAKIMNFPLPDAEGKPLF